MAKKHKRKTAFRKQYPSLFSLIKKGVRSFFAFIWFLLKNWFKILVAILLVWLCYKVYSFLYERYLEDQQAYATVQAERDADTRAVEAAARQDEAEAVSADATEEEEVEWPVSDDVSPDFQPIWGKVEVVPTDFISVEARDRVQEIEANVLRKQQQQQP